MPKLPAGIYRFSRHSKGALLLF